MPVWAAIVIAAIAAIPGSLLGYAALLTARKVEHSVNGLLAARVNAAKAEGRIDEQHDQAEAAK